MATQSGQLSTTGQRRVRRFGTFALAASMALVGLVAVDAATPVSAQAVISPEPGLGTLKTAVDEAAPGSVIMLGRGEYTLNGTLSIGKNITITGVGEPGTADAAGSVIKPKSGSRFGVVAVGTGAIVKINGVTITGGDSRTTGGGIIVASGGDLELRTSTVRGNKAVEGAGIDNNGKLLVDSSTVLDNVATKKGGGIRSGGSATIVNSTFQGNIASQGGALSTPGSGKVVHSTIVGNKATSSSSAGVDRNGGSLQVFYSIIGDNTRTNGTAASDCSGTPDLIGFNLVTDSSGCNPVGPIDDVAPGALGLAPLAANGGSTLTRAVLDASPALDRIAKVAAPDTGCVSAAVLAGYGLGAVEADQRGTRRPAGAGCDLGSFELAKFSVGNFALDVDTSAYPYGDGIVEVGVTSVSVDDIAGALNAPPPATNGSVESSGVRNVGVRNVTVQNIGVRNVGVRNVGVRNVGVRNVGVRNVGVRNVGVRNVALQQLGIDTFITSIPLSEIPLLASANRSVLDGGDGRGLVPDGWSEYLEGTQFEGLPLQSLTLEILNLDPPAPLMTGYRPFDLITLEDLDLTNSVLGAIELRSAALADVPLNDIPLAKDLAGNPIPWCNVFVDLCAQIGADALGTLDLLSVQLAGGDVDAVDAATIDLAGTLVPIGVRNVGVRNVTLFSLGVRNVNLQNSGVRNVGVRNVGVRNVALIVNCPADNLPLYCQDIEANDYTLGRLFEELPPEAFVPGATVGDLLDALELGLLDNPDLLDGLSLADFLALFAPNDQVAWEQINLESAQLQNFDDQPSFDYLASFDVTGSAAESLKVTLTLPKGFVLAARGGEVSQLTGGTLSTPLDLAPTASTTGGLLYTFPATALAPGSYVLRVPVLAGVVTGPDQEAISTLAAVGATGPFNFEDKVSVEVVPAPDPDGGGTPGSGSAGGLDFGDLQLAHIAQTGDVDLYKFIAPTDADGATAQVLMSNVPEGVDYDLSIYAPTDTPLRGDTGESGGTRKSVGDIRYDLDPGDDIFPTDIADDINLDALASLDLDPLTPYVLRDISSRRSNSDEEVEIPALQRDKTYYVAVTSYLGDFSPAPYAIRLRTDEATALPVCRSDNRIINAPAGLATVQEALAPVTDATNTLYVTNLEWLASEFPAEYADIVGAALATGDFVGSSVEPAIIDVSADMDGTLDDDVREAYDLWAVNRCDPEYRNEVVKAIGALLDDVQTANVENIVILGDDGIVPMAAVPDLTGYSNEATYARDVLTNGTSNEIAGALGSGYLLSDDPYGTSAGIDIRNAGHQLYVPDVSVGRLVETGEQILQQLENFSDFSGQLDPGTLPVTAAVTGYDFLTDGANAVADGLSGGVADVGTDLINDEWTRDGYLALLAGGGPDIVSPNAHFDYEALLPAAADTADYYSNDELVFTSDVANLAVPVERSLQFTMGCHAGLSVSDVQLGFAAADWAETYADGDNQWLAHTTYGYGDDEIVAYSERLAALFAGNVSDHLLGGTGAPTSIGQAMLLAKQEYLATTFTLTPYDEKILQSWTYYGLPMYEIGGGSSGARSGGSSLLSDFTTSLLTAATGPFGATTTVDGVTRTEVSVDLSRKVGQSGPANLNLVETADGNYYEVGGNTVTAQHRPVQPLVSEPIPNDIDAAGFLITGLTSTDVRPFSPLYLRPTVDLSSIERRIEPGDGSFPSNLQLVTDDGAGSQHLLLAAGQFQSGADDATGTQRLYTSISGELYHSDSADPSDGIGPRFLNIETANAPAIEVKMADPAERVVVLYQPRNKSTWLPLELTEGPANTWTGNLPSTDPTDPLATVEFFVQAVDAQGDVSISDNKVENFFNSGDPDGGPLTITATPEANGEGYNNSDVTVTISAAAASDFDYVSLDGIEVPSYPTDAATDLTLTVIGDGVHVVFARDSSGSGQIFSVTIDSTNPTILSPTVSPTPWSQGPVTVGFLADDPPAGVAPISSGVASITYMFNGSEVAEDPLAPGSVTVPSSGVVSAYATDVAGNVSETASVTVQIDQTAPTVTIEATPAVIAPPSLLWATSTTVTLAAPFGAGEAPTAIDYKVGPNTQGEPLSDWVRYTASFVVETEGQAVWYRATDEALNVSATVQSGALQIDRTAPVANLTVPSPLQLGAVASATKACSDLLGSGIASCALSGAVNATTGVLDTATVGTKQVTLTAIDAVGNTTIATATYTVGYRVCELYDYTQPANPGSANPIKVQLCDANGKNLSSPNIKLTAIVAINTTTGAQQQLQPDFSGGSNTGYEFRFGSKTYIFNLKTDGFPAGAYVLGFVTTPGSLTALERDAIVAANGSTSFARFTVA